MQTRQRVSLVVGAIASASFGLFAFHAASSAGALATRAFLVLLPLGLGAAPLLFTDSEKLSWYLKLILAPWLTMAMFLLGLVVVFKEGAVCLVALALPLVALTMLGTLIGYAMAARRVDKKKRAAAGAALLLLPFLFAPFERALLVRAEEAEALSTIVIDAPPEVVFEQLADVPALQPGEYQPGWLQRLGVPRPIRATVDRRAPGGRRIGEFDDGLRFDERITAYDAPARMAFSIDVDARTLRPGSAERHAFETGYFRFLDATYTLAERGGRTELSLSSRYLLKSGVNWYGRAWAGVVVRDFQERVLAVLKKRAEAAPARASASD